MADEAYRSADGRSAAPLRRGRGRGVYNARPCAHRADRSPACPPSPSPWPCRSWRGPPTSPFSRLPSSRRAPVAPRRWIAPSPSSRATGGCWSSAAHPDDEDTALLALVSQQGGEAAYLSLSRGDGGQNLVGPELGVELGVLRTEELLAARRVDGARQYFTRALDFGYTRSLDETLSRWPRELLAEDLARVVWRFRPQVVVSIFGNDGSGGHGQHRAAGWVAHETFARLGDGAAFPQLVGEGLLPWQPTALYRGAWFAPELATATLSLAAVDPWSGRSTAQLAMVSRSQHRSQDMGRLHRARAARHASLAWVAGGVGQGGEGSVRGDRHQPCRPRRGTAGRRGARPGAGARRGACEARARNGCARRLSSEIVPELAAIVSELGGAVRDGGGLRSHLLLGGGGDPGREARRRRAGSAWPQRGSRSRPPPTARSWCPARPRR